MLSLDEIVGQDGAIAWLRRGLTAGRLPHALMFVGPEGVGRRTTAEALAGLLLCEGPTGETPVAPRTRPCGACPGCRMMAAGTHPDYHLVYKELARYHEDPDVRGRVMQDLGIDVIRGFLIAPAERASARGRGKVFVVRQADLMSDAAQNALLKTLEEPPAGVTIILTAERIEQMLPTTVSRCAIVRFGRLPSQFVSRRLTDSGVSAEEAAFWSLFTDGSIGRAVRLAGEGVYALKRRLLELLAAGDPAELSDFLLSTMEKQAKAAVDAAKKADGVEMSKSLAARQAASTVLDLLASAFRDALRLACAQAQDKPPLPLVHADQPEAVAALAGRLAPDNLVEVIEALSRYESLLWRNVNPKIVWDNAAIACTSGAAGMVGLDD